MAIYKVVNESTAPEPEESKKNNYLSETKSEAISDLKNKTTSGNSYNIYGEKRKDNQNIYAKGKNSNKNYEDLQEKLAKISKPMRTAQDYKDREDFYSTSNKLQSKDENRMDRARAFAKRPVLGLLMRKINRKLDDKYKGSNASRDRKGRYSPVSGGSYHLETFNACSDYVVGCLEGNIDDFDLNLFTEASAFIIDYLNKNE